MFRRRNRGVTYASRSGMTHVNPSGNASPVWGYTEANELYLFGKTGKGLEGISRETLAQALTRLREKIAGNPDYRSMRIIAVRVEWHWALGLWSSGELNYRHFGEAFVRRDSILLPTFFIDDIPLVVTNGQYWEGYEFRVVGHPEGHTVVRDVPDLLGAIAKESAF